MNLHWKRVGIDSLIVFAASFAVGFLAGFIGAFTGNEVYLLAGMNFVAISGAFAYVSARIPKQPWEHLCAVAIGVWLISIIQSLFGLVSYSSWVLSLIMIFVLMGIGGAIGRLFARRS